MEEQKIEQKKEFQNESGNVLNNNSENGLKDVAAAESGDRKGKGITKKHIIITCLAVILAAAALGWYNYNRPEERLGRALEEAQILLDEKNYEEASAAFAEAEAINGVSPEALEGHILANLYKTDELAAQASDIPSRAKVCGLYAEVIELCDAAAAAVQDTSDPRFAKPRADAEAKRTALQAQIAADYETVEYTTQTQDRSDAVQLPDGTTIPYAHYFDLTEINDEYYPYAEKINESIKEQMDNYFAATEGGPSAAIATAGSSAKDSVYRDYVGVEGVYTGQGLFCIRMAQVKVLDGVQSSDYCGRTFRLSDAKDVTLADIAGMTETGLRGVAIDTIWNWLDQEGYSDISKSDVEDYVEGLIAEDIKYCFQDDGTICLILDQTAPFFADRQEILEIPVSFDKE